MVHFGKQQELLPVFRTKAPGRPLGVGGLRVLGGSDWSTGSGKGKQVSRFPPGMTARKAAASTKTGLAFEMPAPRQPQRRERGVPIFFLAEITFLY
jgi:hypothetical protein